MIIVVSSNVPPMMTSVPYRERSSKYKTFSEREWNLKNTFTYDDYKGFSDLKILKIQNVDRFYGLQEQYGLPADGIRGFCKDFCFDNKRIRLIQRHLCAMKCFWNPQHCFWDKCHSDNCSQSSADASAASGF